jgi:hypothetical protein
MNPKDEKIQRENLEAFEKMLSIQENRKEQLQGRERCYVDSYGHRYLWTTHRQDDGKFHCRIAKRKKNRFSKSFYFTTTKEISFVKRNTAKSWCLKNCLKAQSRQDKVLAKRAESKAERAEVKKALNTKDVMIEKKINHLLLLVKKADRRIKSNETRKKTLEKKLKYYKKRLEQERISA